MNHSLPADAAACLANDSKRRSDKIKATKARNKYEQALAVGEIPRLWTHCADPWNDLKQPMKAYLCQSVRDKLRELDELDYQRRRRA